MILSVRANVCVLSVRKPLLILLCALSALGLSACSDGGDSGSVAPVTDPNDSVPQPSEDTIAANLLKRSEYQTVLRLIEDADLTDMLQENNSGMGWTLFAPTDDAFDNEPFQALSAEQEVALIRRHVYSGTLLYEELMPGELAMIQGSVPVTLKQDGKVSVGGAAIIARDRVMSNGVIHFVGSTLDPVQP